MAKIDLVDISIRDGNQSLWGATGLNTAQIVQIAPVMDRVGFRALDFNSSTHMAMAVRYKQENPWDLIRLTHAAAPNTPLQYITDGIPLYLLGNRRSGFHAAGLPLHRAGRDRTHHRARSDARSRRAPHLREDGEGGRHRRRDGGADLYGERGA